MQQSSTHFEQKVSFYSPPNYIHFSLSQNKIFISVVAMLYFDLSTPLLFCILPLISLFFFKLLTNFSSSPKKSTNSSPPSYPLIGSFIEIFVNKDRRIQWTSDLVKSSPSSTVVVQRPLGEVSILTANPANVQHILKSRFDIYQKGDGFRRTLSDLLGNGIFNADGQVLNTVFNLCLLEFIRIENY